MKICIAGCGAAGSQVAWHIAHPDHEFLLIDDDRCERHNVITGTSMYSLHHIDMFKVHALAELLWRRAECRCTPWPKTLETSRVIVDWKPDIVIDGFDNVTARALTTHLHYDGVFHDPEMRQSVKIPTVHVGVSEARSGEVTWDERYQLPSATFERNDEAAPCTHVLGRQILRFTSSVAAGVIERYIATGEKIDLIVTERMSVLK